MATVDPPASEPVGKELSGAQETRLSLGSSPQPTLGSGVHCLGDHLLPRSPTVCQVKCFFQIKSQLALPTLRKKKKERKNKHKKMRRPVSLPRNHCRWEDRQSLSENLWEFRSSWAEAGLPGVGLPGGATDENHSLRGAEKCLPRLHSSCGWVEKGVVLCNSPNHSSFRPDCLSEQGWVGEKRSFFVGVYLNCLDK